jgi:hypothetical protein
MKTKQFLMVGMTVTASIMIMACGSTKQSLQNTTGQVAIEQDICEKLQEEKPLVRAVGTGQHFREATARNIAEVQARAQFARTLGPKIKASTADDGGGNALYSGDDLSGNAVDDQMAKINDFAQSIANEVVAGMVLIKTSKYMLPNKQYKVYVCLEYQKGVSEMATRIATKVEQKISDEQKLKMNFEFEQYRKRIEEELEKSR